MNGYTSFLLLTSFLHFGPPQPPSRQVVLHNGYESGKLVRNHTVLHYTFRSEEKTEGYVLVNRVIEYAVPEMVNEYAYHYQTDTLCRFSGKTVNGKKQGTFLSFPSGNIFFLHTYTAGVENGSFQGYYYLGQRYCTGTYQQGVQSGPYRQYYANGKLALQEQLLDYAGHVLRHEAYDIEGRIAARGYLAGERKVNEWQYFHPDGRVAKTEYYSKKGRLVAVRQ